MGVYKPNIIRIVYMIYIVCIHIICIVYIAHKILHENKSDSKIYSIIFDKI